MSHIPFDPLALWRDMLAKWEAGFNDLAGKKMAPPEFMTGLMGHYLTSMNMPTRADLLALEERLRRIEDQLACIAARTEPVPGGFEGKSARAGQGERAVSKNGPSAEAHAPAPAAGGKSQRRPGKKRRQPSSAHGDRRRQKPS